MKRAPERENKQTKLKENRIYIFKPIKVRDGMKVHTKTKEMK
jgi:hypothetical protein